MKKKEKVKLTKFFIFCVITILAVISSYYLDFKEILNDNVNIYTDNKNSTVISNNDIEEDLQIHYIDVGQADGILIEQNDHYMVIDAGKNDTEQNFVNYLKEQGVKKLDYVIGTHAHEDHIGGIDLVIKEFDVDKIFFPKQTATTKTFENFALAVKEKGKQVYAPKSLEKYEFEDTTFEILAPNSESYESTNDYSIVIKLTYKDNTFLFTGDAEILSENEILNLGVDLKCNVLKVGHHGSKTSTSKKFLDAVNPEIAVISVGKDNSYNHPTKNVMQRLKNKNITVYRTDESGTIILNSDGNKISSNVSPGTYNYAN